MVTILVCKIVTIHESDDGDGNNSFNIEMPMSLATRRVDVFVYLATICMGFRNNVQPKLLSLFIGVLT